MDGTAGRGATEEGAGRGRHRAWPGTDRRIEQLLEATARWLAVCLIEVIEGSRPVEHLVDEVSPAVALRLRGWSRRPEPVLGRRHGTSAPVRVRSSRSSRPSPTAFEASVVIEHGRRVRAIAVRFEQHDGHWRSVELAPVDCGLPALRTASLARRPAAADDDGPADDRAGQDPAGPGTESPDPAGGDAHGDGERGTEGASGRDPDGASGRDPDGDDLGPWGERPRPRRPQGGPTAGRVASEAPAGPAPALVGRGPCVAVRRRGSA